MKTNYKAFKEVERHYLHYKDEIKRGILNERENELINAEYSLDEKDLIQLQDARDFTVAIITNSLGKNDENDWFLMDLMSAITFAIDCKIVEKGGRV